MKPSNILIGDDGLPKLIDLGLVSPLASDALRQISGTFPYMSPEQARGQVERIDARSDVFGLGAVLYELLTGRPPYRGRDLDDVWDQAREGRVAAPREFKRSISRSLERVCMKALAADPAPVHLGGGVPAGVTPRAAATATVCRRRATRGGGARRGCRPGHTAPPAN